MKRKVKVVCGKKTKTISISGEPRKITIFKLGSEARGWVPDPRHFDAFNKKLKDVLDGKTDIIVFHFGVNVEQVTI